MIEHDIRKHPNRSGTVRAVQAQLEILDFESRVVLSCSENKGADQLRSYCEGLFFS